MKKTTFLTAGFLCLLLSCIAQEKLTLDNVRKAYLRNSGTILENNEVRGYFVFYQSDKIDKKTNEYTLQIMDENLNKIKDIKMEEDKNIDVLEASYNASSIMFLFHNPKEKTLEYRAYGFDGKIKMTYTKELNKRSEWLLRETYGNTSEDSQNEALFDIENTGYVTVYPVKEGKYYSYEVNFFFTDRKKQWTFEAAEEQEDKWSKAVYLGATDSLVVFEVVKQKTLMGGKPHSWLLGLNMFSGKKEFEISTEAEDYKFYPMNISSIAGKRDFMLMGPYYEPDAKIMKDRSLGLACWTYDTKGKVVAKKYNSWDVNISKYLNADQKGRVENIGYVFFHKILQVENGDFFAIGEGYKKVVSGAGVALNALSMLGGGSPGASNFDVKVTDMVIMEFNDKFEIKAASIYDKFNNTVSMPAGAGYMSPHTMALLVKAYDGFDYDFTKTDKTHSTFYVGYRDYEKTKDFKGVTFNSISYYGNKLTTDKIPLKSKTSRLRVYPAKTGFVTISEYFKKEKRLEFRLEKLN